MKIILGADPLLSPLTGIGHYTRSLALALMREPNVEELALFAYGKFFPKSILDTPEISSKTSLVQRQSFSSKLRGHLAAFPPAIWAFEKLLPSVERWRLSGMHDYLFHAPNFFIPAFSGAKVVTFHDLSTFLHSACHPKARVDLANRQMEIAVASDAHILCDTQFIAKQVVSYFGLSESRVSYVHLAAELDFRPRSELECAKVLELFGVKYKEFFLFVSTIEPRKNLLRLLNAYEHYVSLNNNPLPLVIVGSIGWNSSIEHDKIRDLQRKGLVRYNGYLAQHYVHVLFSAAKALLYPSVYEGFGLPVLEAMQSGTVVLTSQYSAMQEVCADSALYVDPYDELQIAKHLSLLHGNDAILSSLQEAGLNRSLHFNWQKSAFNTFAVYQQVFKHLSK